MPEPSMPRASATTIDADCSSAFAGVAVSPDTRSKAASTQTVAMPRE
jgi:hypothetical protein